MVSGRDSFRNVVIKTPYDLNKDELVKLLALISGNVLVHYGMWFTETVNRLGLHEAIQLESKAFAKYAPLASKKLGPHLETPNKEDLASLVSEKSEKEVLELIRDLAKTWVASDGVWFQAVETSAGMFVAKEINDRCWANFAALEAFKILQFLGLSAGCGLVGLQEALEFRTYSLINKHVSEIMEDGSLLLTFHECRVQNSRRRKKMDDYPCKSAGLIEYSNFAAFVDSRIVTECVYCPPDKVTEEQFCSWRFLMD